MRIGMFWRYANLIQMPGNFHWVLEYKGCRNVNFDSSNVSIYLNSSVDIVHIANREKTFIFVQSTLHVYKNKLLTCKRVVSGTRTYKTPLNIYWTIERGEINDISNLIEKSLFRKPVIVVEILKPETKLEQYRGFRFRVLSIWTGYCAGYNKRISNRLHVCRNIIEWYSALLKLPVLFVSTLLFIAHFKNLTKIVLFYCLRVLFVITPYCCRCITLP